MALSLDAFKKKGEINNRLAKAISASTSFGESAGPDENVWKPTLDKDGNATALIRFLFNPDGDDGFYQTLRKHAFQGKSWYIENCPKTKDWNARCPACEQAETMKDGRTWKDIPENEQGKIRKYFSTVGYWTNIYVIKDKNNPAAEGKVWKYCFGRKILAKIEEALKEDPITGEPGFSAFDPLNGADFRISVKQVGGFNNYDDSRFSTPAPFLEGNEKEILAVLNNLYDLSYVTSDESFKSYEELAKSFKRATGITVSEEDGDGEIEEPKPKKKAPTPKPKKKEEPVEEPEETEAEEDDSGVDDDYFQKLVDDL